MSAAGSRRAALLWTTIAAIGCWSEGPEIPGGEADGICLELPCADSVSIDVTRRDEGVFFPGAYTFVVEIESGDPVTKRCELRADGVSCSGAAALSVRVTDGDARFVVTLVESAPERLLMSVLYESREIGSELIAPEYVYLHADDPDCGLTCLQGTAAMQTSSSESR